MRRPLKMIQMSWRWLLWQAPTAIWPNGVRKRHTEGAATLGECGGLMAMALARKLLIALWRYPVTNRFRAWLHGAHRDLTAAASVSSPPQRLAIAGKPPGGNLV